eukprot:TRINITY_DN460_c0_g1_i1.p1 TRINITY_DN460_c0_g1~~TRINITY_DN460_c0_g1_i1.p1  ORF type:complete len:182 (-),score=33.08 TRINITY_DN460_c0_g1_i1:791-1336(-)
MSEIDLATEDQVSKLKSWIGGKPKFELLYRASRDGWSTATFHELCDDQGATLSIGKSKSGYVMGGYCTVPWSTASRYFRDGTAFLFSLTDGKSRNPVQLKQHANFSTAVYHRSTRGPTFGGGVDLTFLLNTQVGRSFLGYCYLVPKKSEEEYEDGFTFLAGKDADMNDFPMSDVEVYRVIK